MDPKLNNPKLLRLLFYGGKLTDSTRWKYLHELIRKFHLYIFFPWFASYLYRHGKKTQFRILPRHSVQEQGGFNFFLSDLDFTIIFQEEPTESELSKVLFHYFTLAKTFRFIGELEIYTESEWSLKLELEMKNKDLLDFIWNFRKWGWQRIAFSQAKSPYHQYKAQRSILRILKKLGISNSSQSFLDPTPQLLSFSLNKFVHSYLSKTLTHSLQEAPKITGKSNYLEWHLFEVNALFAALLPDGEHINSELKAEIRVFRKIPEIAQGLSALCQFDLLLMQSKWRAYGVQPSSYWNQYLNETISHCKVIERV